ncbi:GNAT family N-acetyltransferase [Bacillus sp. X1(2014)]|uniref:GNAT family N-acetyltransferase n=1 Tax=Bacillus sp. X1(2014) TaxID=1565991 RepID=UPI0016431106|nr:GNAT family N-acetyltransferase [Bacillus sp. X1(2014)]
MKELLFIKDYKDHEYLRTSFNQLASDTFGIEFETWHQNGYWTEKYLPYSFVDHRQVVANVSVNLVNLVVNAEVKQAIQIGTVMTHPNYRNKGLSRRLMEIVLDEYKHVDIIYLFANQNVLDFYPKFGFSSTDEVQFILDYNHMPAVSSKVRKLVASNPEDLEYIYNLARNRKVISEQFGTSNCEELLMFYCIMVFSQDLYYLEKENALVIFQREEGDIHLYDIVSPRKVNLQTVLSTIVPPDCSRVIFHFHPDEHELGYEKQQYKTNNVLFIKNLTNVSLPNEFKHPLTSQA